MEDAKRAYIYVAGAILLWGSTPAVAKLLLADLSQFQVLSFTAPLATLMLFIAAAAQGKLGQIQEYHARDYAIMALMGGLGVFAYYGLFYTSLSLLPAQETTIVNYLWPIMVFAFAYLLLGEKIGPSSWLAIALSFVGVFITVSKDGMSMPLSSAIGAACAFLGAVCYSLFSVLGKRLKYDKTISLMFYYAFASIMVLAYTAVFSDFKVPSAGTLLGLVWIGFVAAAGFLLWFMALKEGDTKLIANSVYITPFAALVYIQVILGEHITIASIVGLVFVACGMGIQVWSGKRR